VNQWKEGARRGSADDKCPGCGHGGVLAFDFSKFGKHTMVACDNCDSIFVDSKLAAKIERGES